MILLSLALVVASAATLAIGVITTSDALVWTSLGAGLGAVALVAGSVSRRRPAAGVPDAAGPDTAGAVVVGSASAGFDPAPSPMPSRTAPVAPPGPASGAQSVPSEVAGPVSPGPTAGPQPPAAGPERPAEDSASRDPDSASPTGWGTGDRSPWSTVPPPPRSGASRHGWTGAVPAVPPPPVVPLAPEPRPTALPGSGPLPPGSPPPAGPVPTPPVEVEEGVEVVPVRDALRVAQLGDEVLVVDGRPRYHLAGCATLAGADPMPLAVSAARRGGFTPCSVCSPDRTLLDRSRSRAAERSIEDRERPARDDTGSD